MSTIASNPYGLIINPLAFSSANSLSSTFNLALSSSNYSQVQSELNIISTALGKQGYNVSAFNNLVNSSDGLNRNQEKIVNWLNKVQDTDLQNVLTEIQKPSFRVNYQMFSSGASAMAKFRRVMNQAPEYSENTVAGLKENEQENADRKSRQKLIRHAREYTDRKLKEFLAENKEGMNVNPNDFKVEIPRMTGREKALNKKVQRALNIGKEPILRSTLAEVEKQIENGFKTERVYIMAVLLVNALIETTMKSGSSLTKKEINRAVKKGQREVLKLRREQGIDDTSTDAEQLLHLKGVDVVIDKSARDMENAEKAKAKEKSDKIFEYMERTNAYFESVFNARKISYDNYFEKAKILFSHGDFVNASAILLAGLDENPNSRRMQRAFTALALEDNTGLAPFLYSMRDVKIDKSVMLNILKMYIASVDDKRLEKHRYYLAKTALELDLDKSYISNVLIPDSVVLNDNKPKNAKEFYNRVLIAAIKYKMSGFKDVRYLQYVNDQCELCLKEEDNDEIIKDVLRMLLKTKSLLNDEKGVTDVVDRIIVHEGNEVTPLNRALVLFERDYVEQAMENILKGLAETASDAESQLEYLKQIFQAIGNVFGIDGFEDEIFRQMQDILPVMNDISPVERLVMLESLLKSIGLPSEAVSNLKAATADVMGESLSGLTGDNKGEERTFNDIQGLITKARINSTDRTAKLNEAINLIDEKYESAKLPEGVRAQRATILYMLERDVGIVENILVDMMKYKGIDNPTNVQIGDLLSKYNQYELAIKYYADAVENGDEDSPEKLRSAIISFEISSRFNREAGWNDFVQTMNSLNTQFQISGKMNAYAESAMVVETLKVKRDPSLRH